ncbi:protein-glutamate O-methyltransferase CheR [Pleomorphomonas sp. JP5]|uniref:CheR family methyltransferase n=1 Tax=Pleomorphomonas sp. JP5 TaxID=2942998 RepID=UPI002042D1DA|nr:protein-glutamate O-methyltransferase CheR [Pleomorphomonas sp. JP5]MCM5557966.1 protein-glutamate O-methyltransferase CheR [Pleomorphomonas sp. JP5]
MAALSTSPEHREFPFTLKEYRRLSAFIHGRTGITLPDHKINMVYSRLTRRLRELGFSAFAEYCDYYSSPEGEDEIEYLINALTTNLTRFFREKHHFDHLAENLLSDLSTDGINGRTRLRIWSAGCSTGEEPYSIAMTYRETASSRVRCDTRILATDIDSSVVARGSSGRYGGQSVAELGKGRRYRHFNALSGGEWQVRPELRQLIAFKQLNLLDTWPMKGPFDAIFCRNVMIYFDNPTKARLVQRFADLLAPGGWLYIGHSETILDQKTVFRLRGPTIYQKGT